jgi:hypothetical protein
VTLFKDIFNINYKFQAILRYRVSMLIVGSRINSVCGKIIKIVYVKLLRKFMKLFVLTGFYFTWRYEINFSRHIRK